MKGGKESERREEEGREKENEVSMKERQRNLPASFSTFPQEICTIRARDLTRYRRRGICRSVL
jgi:hypothetical protein